MIRTITAPISNTSETAVSIKIENSSNYSHHTDNTVACCNVLPNNVTSL